MCVCERERKRKKEIERGGEREKERQKRGKWGRPMRIIKCGYSSHAGNIGAVKVLYTVKHTLNRPAVDPFHICRRETMFE